MSKQKSIVLGGKEISFTKEGFPNKRQLNKAQRQIVDELREKHQQDELEKQKAKILEALGLK
jgi:hypothetical protein